MKANLITSIRTILTKRARKQYKVSNDIGANNTSLWRGVRTGKLPTNKLIELLENEGCELVIRDNEDGQLIVIKNK